MGPTEMEISILYQFLHEYLRKSWTYRLGPPYCDFQNQEYRFTIPKSRTQLEEKRKEQAIAKRYAYHANAVNTRQTIQFDLPRPRFFAKKNVISFLKHPWEFLSSDVFVIDTNRAAIICISLSYSCWSSRLTKTKAKPSSLYELLWVSESYSGQTWNLEIKKEYGSSINRTCKKNKFISQNEKQSL